MIDKYWNRSHDELVTYIDALEADNARLREALARIVLTDTHGVNVPDESGAMRPTGTDFCGRCNRNSYWPHTDDCPIAKAGDALAIPPPKPPEVK